MIKQTTKVVAMAAGVALLALSAGGSVFAASLPTGPQTVVGGGGANYEFHASAPVGQTTTLDEKFGASWQTYGGTASVDFPWTVTVYASSLTSLVWKTSEVGIGTYTGPGNGVWGASYYQTTGTGLSAENTTWLGDFVDEAEPEVTINATDSGSYVAANYQQATLYVYGDYPYEETPQGFYWLVGTTSS